MSKFNPIYFSFTSVRTKYFNGFHYIFFFPTFNLKISCIIGLFTFASFSNSGGKWMESVNFIVTLPVLVMVIFWLKFGLQIFIVWLPIFINFLYSAMNLFLHRLVEPTSSSSSIESTLTIVRLKLYVATRHRQDYALVLWVKLEYTEWFWLNAETCTNNETFPVFSL